MFAVGVLPRAAPGGMGKAGYMQANNTCRAAQQLVMESVADDWRDRAGGEGLVPLGR